MEGEEGGRLSAWAVLFVRTFSVHKVVRSPELDLNMLRARMQSMLNDGRIPGPVQCWVSGSKGCAGCRRGAGKLEAAAAAVMERRTRRTRSGCNKMLSKGQRKRNQRVKTRVADGGQMIAAPDSQKGQTRGLAAERQCDTVHACGWPGHLLLPCRGMLGRPGCYRGPCADPTVLQQLLGPQTFIGFGADFGARAASNEASFPEPFGVLAGSCFVTKRPHSCHPTATPNNTPRAAKTTHSQRSSTHGYDS